MPLGSYPNQPNSPVQSSAARNHARTEHLLEHEKLHGTHTKGMIAKKFVVANRPEDGVPKSEDFSLVEEDLPPLCDGEILCKAEWFAVERFMRIRMEQIPIGSQMVGAQVARVIDSRCADYPVGTQVVGFFGWRDLTIYRVPPRGMESYFSMYEIPDLKGLSVTHAIGACGLTGISGYFAIYKIFDPAPGETVVISTAAGATGSVAGQVAKIRGCKVIGFAGTDEKVKWLRETGFDYAINYKKVNLDELLNVLAPNGIDCYFANNCQGGEVLRVVMQHMNSGGRIAYCTSNFNHGRNRQANFNFETFVVKQLRMEAFVASRWIDEWFVTADKIRDWILEGRIKVAETVKEGFESLPEAMIDLFTSGKCLGKMIVKA